MVVLSYVYLITPFLSQSDWICSFSALWQCGKLASLLDSDFRRFNLFFCVRVMNKIPESSHESQAGFDVEKKVDIYIFHDLSSQK